MYFDRNTNDTDLILELEEEQNFSQNTTGISIDIQEDFPGIKETVIVIENESGAKAIGRDIGTYVTLENKNLWRNDGNYHKEMSQVLAKHLSIFLGEFHRILVVGLGNRNVISDALGPMVIEHLLITGDLEFDDWKPALALSGFSPGVLAQTGMETATLIHSIVQEFHPEIVFAIDALAAKDPRRLNTTIQLSDTGIHPGAGIGNHRRPITKETIGVPIISIGVPTVISITALANRLFSKQDKHSIEKLAQNFHENLLDLFVTPKEIDESIKRISFTISEGINLLHHLS